MNMECKMDISCLLIIRVVREWHRENMEMGDRCQISLRGNSAHSCELPMNTENNIEAT